MAISRDSSSLFNASLGHLGGGNPATATWAHTIGSGNQRILKVFAGLQGGTTANFISCTYGGTAMTLLTSVTGLACYYMINPPVGTANIVVSVNDSGFLPFSGHAVSYFGVYQLSVADSFATPSATATTASLATSVVASNCWLVGCGKTTNNNNQLTAGAGTTALQATFNNGNTASFVTGDSNGTVGTGSQSLSFVASASSSWVSIIVSLAPYVAGQSESLIVAGGGGGSYAASGGGGGGGGGGAGGVQYLKGSVLSAGTFSVTVGNGGTGGNGGTPSSATNGQDSSFNGTTSIGGGRGQEAFATAGISGGSGGGTAYQSGAGGAGTAGQGFAGGQGAPTTSPFPGAGGGGAGAAASNASAGGSGTAGGVGVSNSITGSAVFYGGGGGGGTRGGTAGAGGNGGGGAGSTAAATPGGNGTANRGGGGGGGSDAGLGGNGGSGVVIIRLLTSDWASITGGTQTTDGVSTICTFNSGGSLVLTASSTNTSGLFQIM